MSISIFSKMLKLMMQVNGLQYWNGRNAGVE